MPEPWRLAAPCRDQTQGLVVSGFGHLPEAAALFLDAGAAEPGAAWLRALLADCGGLTITPASGRPRGRQGEDAACAAIAFSANGLRQLGVPAKAMAGFDRPFQEGMHETNRRQRLHDDVLTPDRRARPYWGGNGPALPGTARVPCDQTVHAAILLYAPSHAALKAMVGRAHTRLAAARVNICHRLCLTTGGVPGNGGPRQEVFGFVDGISQPVPWGDSIVTRDGTAYPRDAVHGIAAGDVLLGHINAHGEPAPGPVVPVGVPGAPPDGQLGLNGSYLVMRELSQDAVAFWEAMNAAARDIGAPDGNWVAERVVGRSRNGAPLSDPTAVDNTFLYWQNDRDGMRCPLGAHIRRANPRDGLSPTAATRQTDLGGVNAHRILRRGRTYAAYDLPSAGKLPGLLFMCLNTDLQRQFEFVQQSWLLNGSFAALFDETDPLLGPGGGFSVPDRPIRKRPSIANAVRFVGGEYFFLPSLPALTYFKGLP